MNLIGPTRLALALILVAAPRVSAAQALTTGGILELRGMLVRHDWPALYRELTSRRAAADAQPANEGRYVFAFDAFVSGDSTLQRHLDAWVAAEPESVLPRVARGLYFVEMAWTPINRLDREPAAFDYQESRRWLSLARADARAAIRIDSTEPTAHLITLRMIPVQRDPPSTREALHSYMARWPSTLLARTEYIEELTPRVGNPPALMIGFADSAQRLIARNSRLAVLRGWPAFERGRANGWKDQHTAEIKAYTSALAWGDYWRFRYERGMAYYRAGSLEKALADLDKAIAERPGFVASLAGRASVLAHIAQRDTNWRSSATFKRAQADVDVAFALNRNAHEVVSIVGDSAAADLQTPSSNDAGATTVVAVERAPSASPGTPLQMLALRQMLVQRDFTALDSALASRAALARANPLNENQYVYAFDVFAAPDSALREHLDAWVAHDTLRAFARAARGAYFVARGHRARGTKSADATSAAEWQSMHEWLLLAGVDALAAIRLDPSDVMGHSVVIGIAHLSSSDSTDSLAMRDAIRRQPSSMFMRMQYMGNLRPAWGGSLEALDAYAASEQSAVALNPRMPVLLGMSDVERGEDLDGDNQSQAAVAAYSSALSHGDFWRYRMRRGRAYYFMNEPDKALADLNRAIAERPASVEALTWRALAALLASHQLEGAASESLLRRAREDMRLATVFDASHATVVWARKQLPELVEH